MASPFLKIDNIYKNYCKGNRIIKEALKEISLEIHRGEILGLLGVNGAGKTTLVSILAALHPPTSGDIFWKGVSIFRKLLDYRAALGLCPQYTAIEPQVSLQEGLVFSGRCYGLSKAKALERKNILLDQFRLSPYANSYADQLSGGYKQRFLLARALMHEPELVILDEPTVGLDSHIRRELWEIIAALKKQNTTVLLTTHYLDEAEHLSDRICLIHEGILRTVDTPNNLKKKHKKNSLEEVFLKFVDDPDAEIFNSSIQSLSNGEKQ